MSKNTKIHNIIVLLFLFSSNVMCQTLYSKTFITGSSAKCIESANSFLYLAGGLSAGLLVKTDFTGNIIFSKNYNTNTSQFSINDIVFHNGNIFAVGYTRQSLSPINNYKNYFIAKIDTGNGNIINSIVGGGLFDDEFTKISISTNQEIQILGYLNSDPSTFGNTNGIYVKLDDDLNILTSSKLQISYGNLQLLDIVNILNENYLVGTINSIDFDNDDILICKLDSNSNLLSSKVIDLGYSEIPWAIQYYYNSLFIVGQSNDLVSGSFFGDLFAMKMDTSFNISSCSYINSNSILGEPTLFLVDSNLYINSFGQIFKLDSLAEVIASINMNVISTDQFVNNTSIFFSQEGDFGVLASDTSFVSCLNTNLLISQLPSLVYDTIIPIIQANEPIITSDTIISNNQITFDNLICLLNSDNIIVDLSQQLNIFPNPAKSTFEIQLDGKQQLSLPEFSVELFDLQGHYFGKIKSIGNNRYDASDIPPGFYFLKLITGNISYFEKLTILN